ncbi:MAG: outer membrane protein assembly factor BamC [Candidatus Competibacterales bacterium]
MRLTPPLLVPVILVAVAGCSTLESGVPDRRPDYRQSKTTNPLELPPDLLGSSVDDARQVPDFTGTEAAALSRYTQERRASDPRASLTPAVLSTSAEAMYIERDGDRRWLVVERDATVVWPRLVEFWTTVGFELERDDPQLGILETDWAENRADIPDGPVRQVLKFVADFAYSAPTRDKFRTRIEVVGEDRTEVYLTHYGVEQVATDGGDSARNDESDIYLWRTRPRDPELEAEMLRRLVLFLGASEERSETLVAEATPTQTRDRARRTQGPDGQEALLVATDYGDAWRLVGLALDGSRFVVEDQSRADGLYLVAPRRETERQEGFLNRLAFWQRDEGEGDEARFRVRLADQGTQTLVLVQDNQGRFDNSQEAQDLLDALDEVID